MSIVLQKCLRSHDQTQYVLCQAHNSDYSYSSGGDQKVYYYTFCTLHLYELYKLMVSVIELRVCYFCHPVLKYFRSKSFYQYMRCIQYHLKIKSRRLSVTLVIQWVNKIPNVFCMLNLIMWICLKVERIPSEFNIYECNSLCILVISPVRYKSADYCPVNEREQGLILAHADTLARNIEHRRANSATNLHTAKTVFVIIYTVRLPSDKDVGTSCELISHWKKQ